MDFEDGRFLTHFYSYYRAEIRHTSQESHIMTIHDVKNDSILQVSSQEPSMSFKYNSLSLYLSQNFQYVI